MHAADMPRGCSGDSIPFVETESLETRHARSNKKKRASLASNARYRRKPGGSHLRAPQFPSVLPPFLLRFVVGMRGEAHGSSTMVGARRRFLVLLAVRCGFRALSTRAYSSYSRPPAPPAAWRELLLGHMEGKSLIISHESGNETAPTISRKLTGRPSGGDSSS